MLVRIKGVVEDILMTEGRNKENRPWQKKTYVIRDNMYSKAEYNRKVYVQDFGKLDPNSIEPIFIFRSNHIVGEEVDLACYLETNDFGFTNVDYGKPYDEIGKPKDNVVRPEQEEAQEQVPMQSEETADLPF
jgi:hypothetical protein